MNELILKGKNAKAASFQLMNISTEIKNKALLKNCRKFNFTSS